MGVALAQKSFVTLEREMPNAGVSRTATMRFELGTL
jgi:hypothetical protein